MSLTYYQYKLSVTWEWFICIFYLSFLRSWRAVSYDMSRLQILLLLAKGINRVKQAWPGTMFIFYCVIFASKGQFLLAGWSSNRSALFSWPSLYAVYFLSLSLCDRFPNGCLSAPSHEKELCVIWSDSIIQAIVNYTPFLVFSPYQSRGEHPQQWKHSSR